MKNIKELGLEVIQLEDQVLLVDNINMSESPYILWKNKVYSNKIHSFIGFKYDDCKRVISSTKPIEGLPLLVIENEVDESLERYKDEVGSRYSHSLYQFSKDRIEEGYNKAKETYKFTEDDLRNVIQYGRSMGYNYASQETYSDSQTLRELEEEQNEDVDNYIQSLTKKELWIEVDYDYEEHPELVGNPKEEWYFLKITNNQIKAIWK